MAGLRAIHSVGRSIVNYFRDIYPRPAGDGPDELVACSFQLISSGELVDFAPETTTVTLYLYRIGIDPHLRNRPPVERPASGEARRPLTLELHYLLTAWADSAQAEQQVLSWVMLQLHERPLLDRSMLTEEGGWDAADEIHVVPSELSHEDMMRIWDALVPAYRLSTSYVARVVRLDRPPSPTGRPVVATRFDYRGPPVRGTAEGEAGA
jgi:Pvc16 N-terminal domain